MKKGQKAPVYETLGGKYGEVLIHIYADNEHPVLFTQTVYENQIDNLFNEQLPMDAITVIVKDDEKWESKGWRFGRLGMQARVPIFYSRELAEWYISEIMGDDESAEIRDCREIRNISDIYFQHGAYVILEGDDDVENLEGMLRNIIEERDRINKGIEAIEAKIKKIKPEVTQI